MVVGPFCQADLVHDEDSSQPSVVATRPGALVPVPSRPEIPPSFWRLRPELAWATGKPQLVAVFDTNAIATACCMEARSGYESLATRLVLTRRVPCFIADHVPGELNEHLERIARGQGLDPAVVALVWREQIAPLFRVVDLPIGEYLRPEIAGIRQSEPAGDPDDWPTLALAAFLGPSTIVSRDRVFYRLGYANEAKDWTDTAKVLRRAASLEGKQIDRIASTVMSLKLVSAGIGGLVRLGRRFAWTVPMATVVAVLGARRLWHARDDVRADLVEVGKGVVVPYLRRVGDDMTLYAELRADLVTVQDPPWRSETLVDRCARTLARSGDPMTPSELRDVINQSGGEQVTAVALKRAMREHPSFVRLPGDLYQVGRAVPVD